MGRLNEWLFFIAVALHARRYAAVDPCPSTTTNCTVEDTAGARDLAEGVDCSGGTFNVEWHGPVVVDASIAVGQGSTLNITGVGADASVDGDGATQLFVVSGASLTLSSVQLTNGFAEDGGAAINASSSTVVLQSTAFLGNRGGDVNSLGGAMLVLESVVSFSGETAITENYAIFGAGIYVTGQEAVVSWDGVSTFFNNTCYQRGCAVYADGGSRISWNGDTTFEINMSVDGTGTAVSLEDSVDASWSGRTSFISNTVGRIGTAIYAQSSSTLTFAGETLFHDNYGAIQMAASTCAWDGNTTFSNNSHFNSYGGGAIYAAESNVSWRGETHFTGSTVSSTGGAVSVADSEVSWSGDTYFTGNTASSTGGALYTTGSSVYWSGNTVFSSNVASIAGGALYTVDSNVTLDGETLFSNNYALEQGGAIADGEGDSVSRVVIKGSTNFDDNEAGASGGAIALRGSMEVSIESGAENKVAFTRNVAAVSGGALYLSAVAEGPIWTAVNFSENTATVGGAVYSLASGTYVKTADSGKVLDEFPVSYIRCLFQDNVAVATGGAVESVAGTDYFVNTSFVSNTARSGSGVRLAGTSEFLSCEFNANGAYDEAPAVSNIGYMRNMSYGLFAGNVLLCDSGTFLDYVKDDPDYDHYGTVCDGCADCPNCELEDVDGLICTAQYEHSTSDGTVTLETLEIDPGYWRATNTSRENGILACYNEEACGGGVTGSAGYCAQGYTGPYCSTCTSGFAETLTYTCQRCLGDWKQLTLAILVGALVASASVVFVLYMVSKVSTEPVVQHGRLPTMLRNLWQRLPLQSFKVVIVTWQILTQFGDVANAIYPSSYGSFLDGIAAAVSFDLGWVLSAGCFVAADFHDRLLAATIGPIAVLCLLGGTYLVATRRNSSAPQDLGVVRRKHASAVLLLTFLVYSSVSSTVFRMFACESLDDGYTYLRADYAILCDSAKHEALQVYACFMFVVYPVGIPFLYAVILFRSRDILRDGDRRISDTSPECQSTEDLWKPYKPTRFGYELVECGRRVALTGIIVFTFPNTAAQVATTMILAFLFILVSESLDPYISEKDAWLSRIGNAVVFLSLFLALLVKVDVSDEREYSAGVFGGVLIAVNILMALAVITEAIFMLCTSFGSEGDRVREDLLPRAASARETRGAGVDGSSAWHNSSHNVCEQKDIEQEAQPAST